MENLTFELAFKLGSVGAEVLSVPEARPNEVGHVDLKFVHAQHIVQLVFHKLKLISHVPESAKKIREQRTVPVVDFLKRLTNLVGGFAVEEDDCVKASEENVPESQRLFHCVLAYR